MINTLLLGSGEKRTVIGGAYNYVAKSVFPCSIRVLDKFGGEVDRFDDVTSGFAFKLPEEDLYKLEVTNALYAQDVKVYSGNFEVKGVNEFTNEYRNLTYSQAVAGNYSYNHIKNNTDYAVLMMGRTNNTQGHMMFYTSCAVFGTETDTKYSFDANGNVLSGLEIVIGFHSTTASSYKFYYGSMSLNYPLSDQSIIKIPANKGLIFITSSVNYDSYIISLIKV
jgi:hypothetical protein